MEEYVVQFDIRREDFNKLRDRMNELNKINLCNIKIKSHTAGSAHSKGYKLTISSTDNNLLKEYISDLDI